MARRPRPTSPPRPAAGRAVIVARAALVLAAAVVLAAAAWWRPIDGDEGYYAAAAGLTAAGQQPYADYFYPQAPLLPYVYAPVVAAAGPSLRALRWLSVLLSWATVLVWAWHLARRERERPWLQLAALALLVCAPGVVSWTVTVKTYALTGLLTSLALVLALRGLEPDARPWWLLGAGLAAGLAGSARLFFAPLGPVLAAGLVLWPTDRGRRAALAQAAWLLAGWAGGSLPLATAWLRDPGVFVFDNLGYHALRFSELKAQHPEPSLVRRVGAALAGTGRVLATRPYLLAYLALAGWGAAGLRRAAAAERRALALVALASGVFFLVCMAPDPVYAQYFAAPLITLALPLAAAGLARLTGGALRPLAAAAGAAAVLGTAVVVLLHPGMDRDPVWSFRSYDAVVADIRRLSGPDDLVASFWPGYVFGSGRRYLPGMENQFAIGVSEELTAAQKARYRIADRQRLMTAFRARRPRLVVLGTWMNEVNTALDDRQMLELLQVFQSEYEVVALEGPVKICARVGER